MVATSLSWFSEILNSLKIKVLNLFRYPFKNQIRQILLHVVLLVVVAGMLYTSLDQTDSGLILIEVLSLVLVLMNFRLSAVSSYISGEKYDPEIFFLPAVSILIIGVLTYILENQSFIATGFLTEHLLQVGFTLGAIAVSLVITGKLNLTQREQNGKLLKEQTYEFSKELIQSQELERKRIAADLHDSIGQNLSVIKNKMLMMQKQHELSTEITADLMNIQQMISQSIQEVRTISHGLRPVHLDLLGLTESIKHLIEEVSACSDIRITSAVDSLEGVFSKEAEINVYRIIQECLNNMLKHSFATEGKVLILHEGNDLVKIVIEDNGKGFNPAKKNVGLGMSGMNERTNLLGGTCRISNNGPSGIRVYITIPCHLEVN